MPKKAITISVITVIILALIGGGMFWYLTKTNNNLEQATNTPPQTNQQDNNNEPVVNNDGENNNEAGEDIDTSDWLTYRNEEYGFEFRYPGEWVVSNKYKIFNKYNIIAVENFFVNDYSLKDGSVIKFNVYPNVDTNIYDWLEVNYPIDLETSQLHEQYNIKISSENAIYRVITSNVSGGYFNDISLSKNNSIYYIEIIEHILSKDIKNTEAHNKVIENILNSFKFIN